MLRYALGYHVMVKKGYLLDVKLFSVNLPIPMNTGTTIFNFQYKIFHFLKFSFLKCT